MKLSFIDRRATTLKKRVEWKFYVLDLQSDMSEVTCYFTGHSLLPSTHTSSLVCNQIMTPFGQIVNALITIS